MIAAYADDGSLGAYYRSLSSCGKALCGACGECVCEQLQQSQTTRELQCSDMQHIYDVNDGRRLADVCRCGERRLRKLQ